MAHIERVVERVKSRSERSERVEINEKFVKMLFPTNFHG